MYLGPHRFEMWEHLWYVLFLEIILLIWRFTQNCVDNNHYSVLDILTVVFSYTWPV